MLPHSALVSVVASQVTFMRDPASRSRFAALQQQRTARAQSTDEPARDDSDLEAWAAEVAAESARWPQFERGDAHLSYLPLAHIYERVFIEAAIAVGARVGCWQVRGP